MSVLCMYRTPDIPCLPLEVLVLHSLCLSNTDMTHMYGSFNSFHFFKIAIVSVSMSLFDRSLLAFTYIWTYHFHEHY